MRTDARDGALRDAESESANERLQRAKVSSDLRHEGFDFFLRAGGRGLRETEIKLVRGMDASVRRLRGLPPRTPFLRVD